MITRREWVRGASLVAAAMSVAARPLSAVAQTPRKFRIGVPTWIGYGALYIGRDKGFFSGLDVELRRSDDSNVFNSAMLRGDLDGYCTTLDTFAIAASRNVPGKVVYLFDESAGADGIIARDGIKSLADLRGKTVAAQTGNPNHFFLLYLMSTANIAPSQYTHINLDADKAGAAFVSGKLDAAVTWEPWLSRAKEQGKGRLLVSSKDHPSIMVDALIAHPAVMKRRPEDVRSLVNGLTKAIEFWQASPAEANAIVGKYFSLSPEAVGDMVGGVRFLGADANRQYLAPQGQAASTLALALKIWREAKLIKTMPDLSSATTSDFVR